MRINYNIYNTRANMVVERDLKSYEEAIKIASDMPEWCVASNTLEGRQDFQYTPDFFLDESLKEKKVGIFAKTLAELENEFEIYRQDDIFGLCVNNDYFKDFGAFIAHGLMLINQYELSGEK